MIAVMSKKELLSARVPVEIRDAFWATVPKWSNNETVLEAVAKLWISLPEEIQKSLLIEAVPNNALEPVIRRIVEQVVADSKEHKPHRASRAAKGA